MLLVYGVNPILDPVIVEKLYDIDQVHLEVVGREGIITSGNDGLHSKRSLHYKGRAIDLRTRDLTREQQFNLLFALRDRLGNDFDIILEDVPPHIHLEYDPKGR